MKNPRFLLIDHDDTLVSTFALRARVVAQAVNSVFGQRINGEDYLRSTHGKSLGLMAADFSQDAAQIEVFIDTYRDTYYRENKLGGVSVLPGIAEALSAFHAAGIEIAVVTSKLGRGASDELESCGLLQYVRGVIGSEHVERPKPNAEPLIKGFALLSGSDISEAMMVGDTTADMLGARAAGAIAAAAMWGASDRDALLETKPDFVLQQPADASVVFGIA
jgi:phosphoglycolate phosphatase-like HAD superfamily hydrolase